MRTPRLIALLIVFCLALGVAAPAAYAWANGDPADAFGTHDWALYQGNRLARSQKHRWLNWSTAQSATDDPDTIYGDYYYHAYDVWGTRYGNAPAKIARLYSTMVYQLRGRRTGAASTNMGRLSHYYSDICNPLHTDQSDAEELIHGSYEQDVLPSTDETSESQAWITDGSLKWVSNVATLARSAAAFSHSDYGTLVDGYTAGGASEVEPITADSLNRAAHGLANIIGSTHMAIHAKAGRIRVAISSRRPRPNSRVRVTATLIATNGRRIPGARMFFRWRFKTVTRRASAVSSAVGAASSRRRIGRPARGRRVVITVRASSGGRTATGSTWFIPYYRTPAHIHGITVGWSVTSYGTRYHRLTCRYYRQIRSWNRRRGTVRQARAAGKTPCLVCKPPR